MGAKKRRGYGRKFRVICADPAWHMRDQGTRLAPAYNGTQRSYAHYNIKSNDDIADMDGPFVREVVADDALLFLWCPHALVLEGVAARVARAWGFKTPVQEAIWVKTTLDGRKPRFGGGHYFRVATEPMIIAARGRAASLVKDRGIPNVFFAPRGKHSAKPDVSYRLIEKLFPGPYLELYARRRFSKKWTAWGNECPDPEKMAPSRDQSGRRRSPTTGGIIIPQGCHP